MLKVFMVEDEQVIREGFRNKIPWEQYGFEFAGEAGDGEMALPLIRKIKPDVLITDIKMPFMDGLSLSEIIKEEFPQIRIIIISGYDDFEYARQAIKVGVDQYLLKPVTRLTLRNTLLELKEKIEQENEQKDYQAQYQNEMREYEQFALRRFFEKIFDGTLTVKEIYEEASQRNLELTAACYNLFLVSMYEKRDRNSNERSRRFAKKQEELFHYFQRHPQYVLFNLNVNTYGILIKGDIAGVEEYEESSLDSMRQIFATDSEGIEWYVAAGTAVERLSQLPECYKKANHYFAYRYILPMQHIFTKNTLADQMADQDENSFGEVDFMQMDPDVIRDFLIRGDEKEIHDFVESYLQNIRKPLKSKMFRSYVILNIRFAVVAFLETMGASAPDYSEKIKEEIQKIHGEDSDVLVYFMDMLQMAMRIRDDINSNQGGRILKKAQDYIDAHFDSEELSLNLVADSIGASPNYLSTIFSQNMQKTFVEYVTEKRIDKAKKLLRQTDLSSGEIAKQVGYKDAHYFSFVFKKIRGCSPREYRAEKKR